MAGQAGYGHAVHRARKSLENGYCESFNGKLREECLNGEIFYSLKEAQVIIAKWRVEYNAKRPHSALGPPNPSSQPIAVM